MPETQNSWLQNPVVERGRQAFEVVADGFFDWRDERAVNAIQERVGQIYNPESGVRLPTNPTQGDLERVTRDLKEIDRRLSNRIVRMVRRVFGTGLEMLRSVEDAIQRAQEATENASRFGQTAAFEANKSRSADIVRFNQATLRELHTARGLLVVKLMGLKQIHDALTTALETNRRALQDAEQSMDEGRRLQELENDARGLRKESVQLKIQIGSGMDLAIARVSPQVLTALNKITAQYQEAVFEGSAELLRTRQGIMHALRTGEGLEDAGARATIMSTALEAAQTEKMDVALLDGVLTDPLGETIQGQVSRAIMELRSSLLPLIESTTAAPALLAAPRHVNRVSRIIDVTAWETFVDRLPLSDAEKEKIRTMMTRERYEKAVATAREMNLKLGESDLPTYEKIMATIMAWTPGKFKAICEEMQEPTLIIVSAQTFDEQIEGMNRSKHIVGQEDAYNGYRDRNNDSGIYKKIKRLKKGKVSITEGSSNMATDPSFYSSDEDTNEKELKKKGLRYILLHEAATLMQQSLRTAQEAGDIDRVIDSDSRTLINSDSFRLGVMEVYPNTWLLLRLGKVIRWMGFYHNKVHFGGGLKPYLHARATMEVLEF